MKLSLVLTTINKPNKNIKIFSQKCREKNWRFLIIGDAKTPNNYKIKYGDFYSTSSQKKLSFKFTKICPYNSYTRKNIGYLLAMQNKSNVIIETDDDNCPKNNFFEKINLSHHVRELAGSKWENIYLNFINNRNIWPRGLPLNSIFNKPKYLNRKINKEFYLQQGVCEGNPDVDAIFRLTNSKINVKFKNNLKFSLGQCLSPFNSQNTIWFKKIFPLMYLPVTCTMRATDIWRSLIALIILKNDNKKILFFGTTMFQKRNEHNLTNDFEQEITLYLNSNKIVELLKKVKIKKGEKNYFINLKKLYQVLIKNKIFLKDEIKYLEAWTEDCSKLI